MGKQHDWHAPFRWLSDDLAGQRVFRSSHTGPVPVDVETGFLGRYASYRYLGHVLADGGGDITLAERPGFGGLPGLPGACEIDKHVELKRERLEARREELGDPRARFVLVGHSMGAAITSAFAAKYPKFVASIIDINGIGDPHPEWSLREWYVRGVRSLLPVERRVPKVKAYTAVATRGVVDAVTSAVVQPRQVKGHARLCVGLDNSGNDAAVGKHRIPVIIIRGAKDLWVPEASLQARADLMGVSSSDRHTLPNENHLLGNTVPHRLADIVAQHMDVAVSAQLELATGRPASGGRGLSLR